MPKYPWNETPLWRIAHIIFCVFFSSSLTKRINWNIKLYFLNLKIYTQCMFSSVSFILGINIWKLYGMRIELNVISFSLHAINTYIQWMNEQKKQEIICDMNGTSFFFSVTATCVDNESSLLSYSVYFALAFSIHFNILSTMRSTFLFDFFSFFLFVCNNIRAVE